jgi:transcriptional regulator with XRE-family HTH domain
MSVVQIGKRIASLREKRGLTQAAFATRSGFDQSYVSKIENGHQDPSFGFIKKAAKTLSVSPSYLVASDREIAGVAAYTSESVLFFQRFLKLSDEDKKSVADFLKFLHDEKKRKNSKNQDKTTRL